MKLQDMPQPFPSKWAPHGIVGNEKMLRRNDESVVIVPAAQTLNDPPLYAVTCRDVEVQTRHLVP